MSLSFPAIGQALKSRLLDPIGGMVLSTYIIWQWCIVSRYHCPCRGPMLIQSIGCARPSKRTLPIVSQICPSAHSRKLTLRGTVSGRQADPHEISRVLYLVSRFRAVQAISAVEVYHIGDEIVIEVGLIMSGWNSRSTTLPPFRRSMSSFRGPVACTMPMISGRQYSMSSSLFFRLYAHV